MNKFKILSLDGDGSWAIIQIMCLQHIKPYSPQTRGLDLLADFDLVISNSGGSLAVAALCADLELRQIIDIYLDEKKLKTVFSELGFFEGKLMNKVLKPISPKYSAERKRKGLELLLPQLSNVKMTNLPARVRRKDRDTHFVICNFDYDNNRAIFHRSNLSSPASSSGLAMLLGKPVDTVQKDIDLLDAVHGASNAPVQYFNEPAKYRYHYSGGQSPHPYSHFAWDGAIGGYNNPVAAGVIEAIASGKKAEDIAVLSIGTANNRQPFSYGPAHHVPVQEGCDFLLNRRGETGILDDVKKLSTSIINDPPDAASFTAWMLLNPSFQLNPAHQPALIRMNPMVQPVWKNDKWCLPDGIDGSLFRELIDMDMDVIRGDKIRLVKAFTELWLTDRVPNQAIRADDKFRALIGHDYFSAAREAWYSHTLGVNPDGLLA
jgi:uncharacterized protein